MEPSGGEEDRDGINDDPVLQAAFVAEIERVIGAADMASGSLQFTWLLPVADFSEILAILRRAPSHLGIRGLEAMLQAEFGTLSGMKEIVDDSDEQDV